MLTSPIRPLDQTTPACVTEKYKFMAIWIIRLSGILLTRVLVH